VARHLFKDAIVSSYEWHSAKSVVDSFGDLPIKDVTAALSSVGFSSPPSWIKPFRVLSNGEQFRATMARAILDPRDLVVVDEFTSVIDRTVARVGAHAIAKAIRATPGKRFVAVSCHDDIVEWLQPDWVIEPHVGRFTWRSPRRRPSVDLEIVRASHEAWRWFAPHHYLTAELHKGARCFVGLVEGRPAAFAGLLHFPHPRVRDIVSLSRLVVLPDFQGLGLGAYAFAETIGAIAKANGKRMSIHPSHPALINTWAKSPKWQLTNRPSFHSAASHGARADKAILAAIRASNRAQRRVASFRYVGPGLDAEQAAQARAMWAASAA
jgi:GNAT superfamily N-acetyltransferase